VLVANDLDSRVFSCPRPLARSVGGGVVDDEDAIDEIRDAHERGLDQSLLVVGRDDDRD
jgi:hypothetical protein